MPEDHFGEAVAPGYDDSVAGMFETSELEAAVRFLAGLAGSGAALELGIGTGRVALPLQRHGIHVHGIDLSTAMVAQLRAKTGGEQIGVTVGDRWAPAIGQSPDHRGCGQADQCIGSQEAGGEGNRMVPDVVDVHDVEEERQSDSHRRHQGGQEVPPQRAAQEGAKVLWNKRRHRDEAYVP